MLVPHMSVNSTGEKYSMMHKDLKDLDRSERSELNQDSRTRTGR